MYSRPIAYLILLKHICVLLLLYIADCALQSHGVLLHCIAYCVLQTWPRLGYCVLQAYCVPGTTVEYRALLLQHTTVYSVHPLCNLLCTAATYCLRTTVAHTYLRLEVLVTTHDETAGNIGELGQAPAHAVDLNAELPAGKEAEGDSNNKWRHGQGWRMTALCALCIRKFLRRYKLVRFGEGGEEPVS